MGSILDKDWSSALLEEVIRAVYEDLDNRAKRATQPCLQIKDRGDWATKPVRCLVIHRDRVVLWLCRWVLKT